MNIEIPEFDNVEEEAIWWDEHFAQAWDESRPLEDGIELLPPRITAQVTWPVKYALYQEAQRRQVTVSQLVREWLAERLDLPAFPGSVDHNFSSRPVTDRPGASKFVNCGEGDKR